MMSKRGFIWTVLLVGAGMIGLLSNAYGSGGTGPCTFSPTEPDLDCPYLPDTSAYGVITGGILDYDIFAWDSFIALSWPVAQTTSGQTTTVHRGIPDVSQSFADAGNDVLTVWESLKEKREIFLFDEHTDMPVPEPHPAAWNAPPNYGGTPIPRCTGAQKVSFPREMVQSTKLVFDNLDETAEVASEARESNKALCAGNASMPGCNGTVTDGSTTVAGAPVGPRIYYGQPKTKKNTTPVVYEVKVNYDFYEYLQNFKLDPVPPLTGPLEGFTVFTDTDGNTPLWEQNNAVIAATNGLIRLPARTSEANFPPQPGNQGSLPYGLNPGVKGYNANTCLSNNATSLTDNEPCLAGSVHLKAAWIDLAAAGIAPTVVHGVDTWPDYHTATGYTYETVAGIDPPLCRNSTTLGLIGLHIIQRVHGPAMENPPPQTRGGTFIFATWEHVANDPVGDQDPPFNYANLYPTSSKEPQPYPNVATEDALKLYRYYDVPPNVAAANKLVHGNLKCDTAANPSVWCNYRLIGTQYAADNQPSSVDPKTTFNYDALPTKPVPAIISDNAPGQHHYLANLVIESNLGLQQFQGLPPGIQPIAHFNEPRLPGSTSGTALKGVQPNPYNLPSPTTTTPVGSTTAYDVNSANTAFRIAPKSTGKSASSTATPSGAINMGGCMGCHGVAQQLGYSFSFVLLGNQSGAAIDTQQEADIPPDPNVDPVTLSGSS